MTQVDGDSGPVMSAGGPAVAAGGGTAQMQGTRWRQRVLAVVGCKAAAHTAECEALGTLAGPAWLTCAVVAQADAAD